MHKYVNKKKKQLFSIATTENVRLNTRFRTKSTRFKKRNRVHGPHTSSSQIRENICVHISIVNTYINRMLLQQARTPLARQSLRIRESIELLLYLLYGGGEKKRHNATVGKDRRE